jgi:hypothetical protein
MAEYYYSAMQGRSSLFGLLPHRAQSQRETGDGLIGRSHGNSLTALNAA